MRKLLFLPLLLLAACSAATRYNVNVDVLSFVPQNQRTLSIPSGSFTGFAPGSNFEGQAVSVPVALDIVERGRILLQASVTNTGATPMTGSVELRLAPASDTNLVDNNGGDIGLGNTNVNIPPGQTQTLVIDLTLSSSQNQNAFNIVKTGNFRVGVRAGFNSNGGNLVLNEARIILTGRPFAFLR
ncbi:hypothetical protein DV704_01570 [Meiothermus sp. QL-1]|uniref:hypothetical protein n=1 Tax=Meiothermus sp. QL-1 TaxID=2058095 RepID=UPI000E09FF64|nr:hypothetical protein [Meiothermus sp. QL-1]RDI96532.1 hypothetical protein DV704_01570 [Meiothermus sp. QL-1]